MKTETWVRALLAAASLSAATPALATTVLDPVGDFAPTYTGPHQADLDVVSLSVTYNSVQSMFLVQSTMAGAINPALGGFYVIGVNTGTGVNSFASIGLPGVKFNRVIVVQKNGTAAVNGTALPRGSVLISGSTLSFTVPLSLLPTTGFSPLQYGFNIWPRSGAGGTNVISDFAPDNATIAAVPEPGAWAMMIGGFAVLGAMLRRRRARPAAYRPA